MKRTTLLIAFFALVLLGGTIVKASGILKTQLMVTVRNDLGNIEQGAEVTLYGSIDDYNNEKNAIGPNKTNAKGKVRFIDLEQKAYYIVAKKGDKDNFLAGEKTDVLKSGRINQVTVIIQ